MAIIVQKYGGSSLASSKRIKHLAKRIVDSYKEGNQLVVVVSAMGKTTNELQQKAQELTSHPSGRELDMLLSVGERISISLMSLAINDLESDLACSFTGSQIGLITDCNHGNARIVEIKGDRLKATLAKGKIPIIAGYQGVSTDKEITTLGRGGTDTTAVAVAAAIGADRCEIYSDVDGVYTSDPRKISNTIKHEKISYETMLEMSRLGAQILKDEAVEYAKRLNVKIAAGESKSGYIGTIVTNKKLTNNGLTGLVCYDHLKYLELNSKDNFTESLFYKLPEHRYYSKNSITKSEFIVFDTKYEINIPELKKNAYPCCSISIVGSGLRSHLDKIKNMQKLVIQNLGKDNILTEQFSALSYELFLKIKPHQSLLQNLHDLFFLNESRVKKLSNKG